MTHKDLSGRWIGRYAYDRSGEIVSFEAMLTETAGVLRGETVEPNTFRAELGPVLLAALSGSRTGVEVSFVKAYTDFEDIDRPLYEGRVNAALTRIDGTWRMWNAGWFTGRFMMTRDQPTARARVRERAEEVR